MTKSFAMGIGWGSWQWAWNGSDPRKMRAASALLELGSRKVSAVRFFVGDSMAWCREERLLRLEGRADFMERTKLVNRVC